MEILETKGRKMNKIKREEREDLHTFSDTTDNANRTPITSFNFFVRFISLALFVYSECKAKDLTPVNQSNFDELTNGTDEQ